ncbi:cytochrome P450 [Gloeopeniophorella convolvens]|nr:cytochrome P450 [Gloeopeniophorella convolvens]
MPQAKLNPDDGYGLKCGTAGPGAFTSSNGNARRSGADRSPLDPRFESHDTNSVLEAKIPAMLARARRPDAPSFWLGNEAELRYQTEVGDCEFKWLRQYGTAWRRRGALGVDYLMLADPKALQYVLHTSGYQFPKRPDVVKITELLLGKGIVWAHGTTHQRQRKIMTPAFFAPQLRTFLSLFQNSASKLVQKWKDEVIAADPAGQPLVNVTRWLSRTTLDIIGEAGFDFQFGSLDDAKTPLAKQYENLFIDSSLYPARSDIVFKALWRYIPERILDFSIIKGDGKDIMSVLLRANASEDPRSRLTDNEVIDQISTLLLAGHDTTASSLTWYLWEVAKNPESQVRVREEIIAARGRNGGAEFSAADLDSMTYTQATLKESMRLHPIVYQLAREAGRDDVIPLAFPITTKTGEQISSIPVKKGTPVDISIAAYNRLPEVWGPDVDEWNPERFFTLEKGKQTSVGVFANLLNFSGGLRSCIGWRFSVLEMQLIAVMLLEHFEFSIPPPSEKTRIYRKPSGLMMPMVEGEAGVWMGLIIKALN